MVFEDNTASITMSNDLGLPHKRSKHFGIEFSFFKQSVILKEILPVFVSTDDQPADMLTKTLLPSKFIKFLRYGYGGGSFAKLFRRLKKLGLLLLRERVSYALFLLIATMCYLN